MQHAGRFHLAVAVALGGCGPASAETTSDTPHPAEGPCAAGEMPHAGGCIAAGTQPDGCPAGEVATDGGGCIPPGVPPERCAAGFDPDGQGGCVAVLPRAPCAPGELALLGETACHAVAPCAAGAWGDAPIDPATQFVDAGYAGGDGDGTQQKPWPALQPAIDAAAAGALVAIAAGTYAEDIVLDGKSLRLWGRCPGLVAIVGTGIEPAAIVLRGAGGTVVHGVSITGPEQGLEIRDSEDVRIEAVRVHETGYRGIYADAEDGPTSVTLSGCLVESARRLGLWSSGADLDIEASVVRDTQFGVDGQFGNGVYIEKDDITGKRPAVTLARSIVQGNRKIGVFIAASDVTMTASVVRDTEPASDRTLGRGMQIQDIAGEPSVVAIDGSIVEHNYGFGIGIYASEVKIDRTVVRDTDTELGGDGGRGINLQPSPLDLGRRGGRLELRSSVVERSHDMGVNLSGAEALLEAVIVRDTKPVGGGFGRGVNAQLVLETGLRSTLTVRSSVVEGNASGGIVVLGSDAIVEGTAIRNTQSNPSGTLGRGLDVEAHPMEIPATLELRWSTVEESHEFGLLVGGAQATVEGTRIEGTSPNTLGLFGDGLVVLPWSGPGDVTLIGSRIEKSARAGVTAFGATARLGGVALKCNPLALDGESLGGKAHFFEDRGGNACGCSTDVACAAVSTDLQPPEPLEAN